MKAPERLYLRKRNKLPLEVVRDEWYETDPQNPFGSVEYTRTDAFIEKATLWLLTNASDYCILHNSYDTKELVKDFVDAMKRD